MKKIVALLLFLCASGAWADTISPRMSLVLPSTGTQGSPNWGLKTNTNWSSVDSLVALQASSNTFTSTNSFTGTVLLPTLGNNSGLLCIGVDGAGKIWQMSCPGSGGAPTLSINVNGVQVSSPTSMVNFFGSDFQATLTGASTSYIALNPGTTDFIHNASAVQSATLNITSGTLSTALNLPYIPKGNILFADNNVSPNGVVNGSNNLWWDQPSTSFGIFTSAPLANLHVGYGTNNPSVASQKVIVDYPGDSSVVVVDSTTGNAALYGVVAGQAVLNSPSVGTALTLGTQSSASDVATGGITLRNGTNNNHVTSASTITLYPMTAVGAGTISGSSVTIIAGGVNAPVTTIGGDLVFQAGNGRDAAAGMLKLVSGSATHTSGASGQLIMQTGTGLTSTGTVVLSPGGVTALTASTLTVTMPSVTDSGLTSGRVTVAGASGVLQDFGNFTYNGSNLIVGGGVLTPNLTMNNNSLTASAGSGVSLIKLNNSFNVYASSSVESGGDLFAYGNFTTTNTVTAALFSGSGASLTSIPDGALSSNIPLKNGNNVYTGTFAQVGPANTNDISVTTVTLSTSTTPFGEIEGVKIDATIVTPDTGTLSAGMWVKMHVLENTPLAASSTYTFHSGAIFGEVFPSTSTQEFTYAVEGHNVNVSTEPFAYAVSLIAHTDFVGIQSSSPTADQIGLDSRVEATLPDRKTARTDPIEVNFVSVRTEQPGVVLDRRRYHLMGLTNWGHVAVLGDAFFISTFTQTVAAGDTIIPACGGERDVNAASAVTLDATNPFSAPSISTTGTSNKGCVSQIINNGSFPITIPNSANFNAYGGVSQLFESGDAMSIAGDGGLWTMTGPMKKASGIQTMKGVVLSGGASTATFNASGIIDELIVSSGMSAGFAGETTLYGYSVPANLFLSTASTSVSFPTRQAISIDAAGTTVNATLEEVKVYFGSTVILDSGAGNFSSSSWTAHCDVTQITTGASQIASCHFFDGTTILVNSNTAPAEASTPFIKITGTASVATLNAVKLNQVILKKE